MISLCPFHSAGLKLSYLGIRIFLEGEGFSTADSENLGENLGIPRAIIKALKKNNVGNAAGLFSDVIDDWLNNSEPSWRKLANALSRSGYKRIADKILIHADK